jgi:hypothetical protein
VGHESKAKQSIPITEVGEFLGVGPNPGVRYTLEAAADLWYMVQVELGRKS